uniref:NTP_transf_2 domain-containing protein n=1 Tax=Globodera pallida TaxID=36090 RepID=A0A183C417_GLOPA
MYTLTGPLWRPTIWPMSKSINRLCLVFKNVSTSHQSIASASSSSAPPPLNDVKRKYSAEIDQLSASITEFCSESFERNRELNARIRPIVADIERVVCASGGHSRLVLTGSIASGMAFDASADLNLVIFDAGQRKIFMNDFSATSDAFVQILVMEAIAETLKKFYDANSSGDRMPRLASIASSTRTPVVFGRLDDGLEFNIRFPWADAQRIRNTLMVRYYAQVGPLDGG